MCYILSEHFTGIFLFFCMILYILSSSNISVLAASSNTSEEIKNIFSLSHDTNSVLRESAILGNFAEGGLIDESLSQLGSNSFIKNSGRNLSDDPQRAFLGSLTRHNVSSPLSNSMKNKSYSSLETSIKTLLPSKLTETGSNLFLGVPEVIHINGTSSIKPRKGVHYSKIVPRKGVDNENESFHASLENESCFWLSEKECYSSKGIECSCCKEDNVLGKSVKQTPVNCKNCKTFNTLSSNLVGNQTCKNICCNAFDNNFYSVSSTQNIYNNYKTEPTTEKRDNNLSPIKIYKKIALNNDSPKIKIKESNNFLGFQQKSKFKPIITKVPYDAESMTELLGKAQEKVFVPLAVSLFLLPLVGVIIFFLWQRTKEYWNKRYYKRMDFLIDGIYND